MGLNKILKNTIAVTTICFSSITVINANEQSYFAVELGQVKFDEAVANKEGINTTANTFRFSMEKKYTVWTVAGGIAGFLYGDNENFKQSVVDQFGNQSTASSSSSSINIFVEGGYSYAITDAVSVDALAGHEHLISSSRSISNCSTCSSSDINVTGGFYLNPRVSYQWDNGLKMSLVYRQYLSGDIENAFGLNGAWKF